MKKKLFLKLLPTILVFNLIFQPVYGVAVVLAEEEVVPTQTAENNETGDNTTNTAQTEAEQTTEVTNENNTTIDDTINSDANTGNNTIGEVTPTQEVYLDESLTPTPTEESVSNSEITPEPTPTETQDQILIDIVPTPTITETQEEATLSSETPAPGDEQGALTSEETQTEEETPVGICAENENTGEDSSNEARASSSQTTIVSNTNTAEIINSLDVDSNSGENAIEGEDGEINTGDTSATIDSSNVVNTNLTGEDYWQTIINLFLTSQNDIDLTDMPELNSLDPALLSVLAKNVNTGDGSINMALANFLSSYAIYNQNYGSLTNNINLGANSGGNQIIGEDGTILTGDALTNINLFNMLNTNLTGEDWFFGIINLFGSLEGDIILPYELDYLMGNAMCVNETLAANSNTGENSTNNASTNSIDSTVISNSNDGNVANNINSSANSGNNSISQSGDIQTGNASSLVNLINTINTNITGSNWLLLTINNIGKWSGSLVGWWGNFFTIGNTGYAWIKLPDSLIGNSASSVNQNTGGGSTNNAGANATNSLLVSNNNQAQITNNITAGADTGNNQIIGEDGLIQTGDAESKVNVVNMVNTNITGNHWFFGVINLFDSFLGNIIFPRPDLAINIGVNSANVLPNQELTYIISYKNLGRVWSRNTTVTNSLPANVSFISCSNGCLVNGANLIWNLGKLDKGSEGSVSLTVKVSPDVLNGTQLTDSAQIFTDMDEPNKTNNAGGVTVLASWLAGSDQNSNNEGSSNNNANNNGGSSEDNSGSSNGSQGSGGESQATTALSGENSYLSYYPETLSVVEEIVKTTKVNHKSEVLGSQTTKTNKSLLNIIVEKSWLGLIFVVLIGMMIRIKKYLALRA